MFLILIISLSLNNLLPTPPWSHLKTGRMGLNTDLLIPKLMVDGDPVRYCVFIESGADITKKSATTQVYAGLMNMLKAIRFYDSNNRVFDKKGNEIDTNNPDIQELKCHFTEQRLGIFSPEGVDKTGSIIPEGKFLPVFFTAKYKNNIPTATYSQNKKFSYSNNSKTINVKLKHAIIIPMDKYRDISSFLNEEILANLKSILTDNVYKWVSKQEELGKSGLYTSNNLCNNCEDNTFTVLLHELSHAFGQGEESGSHVVDPNDPEYQSAIRLDSVTRQRLFFPTKSDVVGISYIFDRLSGRDPYSRSFDFKNFPPSQYSRTCKDVVQKNYYGTPILVSGTRTNYTKNVHLTEDTSKVTLITITDDDFKNRMLPKLINHDASLQKRNLMLTELAVIGLSYVNNNSSKYDFLEGISKLNKLTVLTIRDFDLHEFPPEELKSMQSLNELNLVILGLKSLPSTIKNLVNLRVLNLYGNKLTTIPSEITDLKNLEEIELRANPLKSLPEGILNMPNLKELLVNVKILDASSKSMLKILEEKGVEIIE